MKTQGFAATGILVLFACMASAAVDIAHTDFREPPEGVANWSPGTADTELGFATTRVGGTPYYLGTYDSPTSPELFRMRTVEAVTEMDTVDLRGYQSVTANIKIKIKSTGYESGDYYRAIVADGAGDTLDLARVEGTALNSVNDNVYHYYTVDIPDSWSHATLTVSSRTNSSADSEAVDFDAIYFATQTVFAAEAPFHFTATADMRDVHDNFVNVCQAIKRNVGGAGLFHVSPGDIDGSIAENRAVIDSVFGSATVWYPGIGNHEAETLADMTWLRNEYHDGNGARTPLKVYTNQDGPTSTRETTYSWDHPASNSHFVMLNEYWDGSSDTGTNGDIVQPLYDWLETDLRANRDKAIFVFGHEPAYPEHRHVGDSLDQYPSNRDAFWQLLEENDVVAYVCGHTHYFSKHQGDKDGVGNVWQIDLGNAGNVPGASTEDGMTFLDVAMLDGRVRFDVYRNVGGYWDLADAWKVAAKTVPEPATLTLLGLSLMALLRYRGRRA